MLYYVYVDGSHVDTIEESETYTASEYVNSCIGNNDADYFEDGAKIKLVPMRGEPIADAYIYNRKGGRK